jgi:hypothetical protein
MRGTFGAHERENCPETMRNAAGQTVCPTHWPRSGTPRTRPGLQADSSSIRCPSCPPRWKASPSGVREQIATATEHIRSRDVATAIRGSHIHHIGFPGGDSREDPHPVISFIERVVLPSASLSASLLADEWLTTFLELRQQMRAERTGAWFAREEKFPLTYETPFNWDSGWDTDQGGTFTRETALVEAELAAHPEFGNGLRIVMYVPRAGRPGTDMPSTR